VREGGTSFMLREVLHKWWYKYVYGRDPRGDFSSLGNLKISNGW
jgi:hypothetical protein